MKSTVLSLVRRSKQILADASGTTCHGAIAQQFKILEAETRSNTTAHQAVAPLAVRCHPDTGFNINHGVIEAHGGFPRAFIVVAVLKKAQRRSANKGPDFVASMHAVPVTDVLCSQQEQHGCDGTAL